MNLIKETAKQVDYQWREEHSAQNPYRQSFMASIVGKAKIILDKKYHNNVYERFRFTKKSCHKFSFCSSSLELFNYKSKDIDIIELFESILGLCCSS